MVIQLCVKTRFFNHNKALSASHNDESIALKLRDLFILDLPSQLTKADVMMSKNQIGDLQNQLHYILGGAQVCAADGLIQLITELKLRLKTARSMDKTTEKLWQEINDINTAMQNQCF